MTLACQEKNIAHPLDDSTRRSRIKVEGIVQGVGFRPYVKRLAFTSGLNGRVFNSGSGVSIDIEGTQDAINNFYDTLLEEMPPLARIDNIQQQSLPAVGFRGFTIEESESATINTALISPDVATCPDCLDEILDKRNRRYAYPFTNCTNCGPRFSIIEALPFDRPNTTMKDFRMCDRCQSEYDSRDNRRYHAQANACPDCGPQLSFMEQSGQTVAIKNAALSAATAAIRDGKIVAIKGIGGFQLLVDARNNEAVTTLRQRKARPDKPFALMFPTVSSIKDHCLISRKEHEILRSHTAPIVLLERHKHQNSDETLAEAIAPNNPYYGVMLPCSPLHHLLLHELGFPVIATSGNLSGDPIVIDEEDALVRLNGIADYYLVHDRPIVMPLDDSVVQLVAGRASIVRRARGLAPFSLPVASSEKPILALGGHLKATVALALDNGVIIGPHIGNLDNVYSRHQYEMTIDHFQKLYCPPACIACDQHPDYYSSRYAHNRRLKTMPVQHHVAHVISCMAENNLEERVLGVAWDGTGYSNDNTIWGGEFFIVDSLSIKRVASLRPFPLPGGERAITEPRRAAMGLLYELFGNEALTNETLKSVMTFTASERKLLQRMLERRINSPMTSSMGRLFDVVAALTGLHQFTSFEGQAAMALEFAINRESADRHYAFNLETDKTSGLTIIDWQPMIVALMKDIKNGVATSLVAASFHNSLVKMILSIARQTGETNIVLTGGCFQNRYLTEQTIQGLRAAKLAPFWHQHVPPNDGGLALGQAVWAARHVEAGLI